MSFESTPTAMKERAANANPLGSTLQFNFYDGIVFIDGSASGNALCT